jgi:predicted DsbA family dithiol-disulfide isomerase
MLIAAARQQGRGDALVEALFRAYFEECRDVGDAAVLLDVAEGVGLDRQVALTALNSEELRSFVVSVEAQAAEMQIGGVPFFIVDHRWAVSGAESAAQWVSLIRQRPNA